MRFKLTVGRGSREITMPTEIYEVPLNRYLDFQDEVKVFSSIIDKMDNGNVKELYKQSVASKARAICAFFGVDYEELQVRGGEPMAEVIDIVFNDILELIGGYEPTNSDQDEYVFTHKGVSYKVVKALRLVDFIESMEVQNGLNKANADESSLLYTEAVNLLATLALADGDKLDEDEYETEMRIEGRRAIFADIAFPIGLDVVFFFASCTLNSRQRIALSGFLSLLSQ